MFNFNLSNVAFDSLLKKLIYFLKNATINLITYVTNLI